MDDIMRMPLISRFVIRGIYINAYIGDEGTLVKTSPYKVDGQFVQTRLH
jgi:hypothetical protein